ncbi:WhiB family transcriptional regulator [Galbitalea sp. SE-J8]|uniref:WhiB family transcriptional regulator n=1 Tax=Galbitalea sp. SE-J8 TaxID=3054952 RepID=UPI00259D18C6|nr:WhiB family transcriptional regulator [Galbitalea sp. SE-J8]MDM4762717.1 WhiB family transcriptional regulator [Galbitalea sp. SE-J8]
MVSNEFPRPVDAGSTDARALGLDAVAPSTADDRRVPGDWFVDPVRLGVPGVRRPAAPEDEELAWQSDSLCAQTDPEAFFPEKGGSTRDAKRICASCEVRAECLEYALKNDERYGIWGGLSERERRKLRKRA